MAAERGVETPNTVDIFTEVSRGIDKHLWMVEAQSNADSKNTNHQQKEREHG
jgi:hypothetical protein